MAEPSSDRRRHTRMPLECPARVSDGDQEGVAWGGVRTLNISDGGMLLPLPAAEGLCRGQQVEVRFSVPRSTPNTYMLESFTARASVVRLDTAGEPDAHRVALRFEPPLRLDL